MMKKILVSLVFTFSFIVGNLNAQKSADKPLKVGYAGSAPFVIHEEGKTAPEGIVFDIWKEIAFSIDQKYDLEPVPTIAEGISSIKKGELDLIIGPITINSARAAEISFSQPYYDTELAILAPVLEQTVWDHIKPFFTTTFLFALLGLLLTLSIVGFLFWLVEGRHFPDDYPQNPIRCIGIGIWLGVVTMTTVGYGDFAPKTARGRILMGSWMVISLILATSFVAGIATTFSQVNRSNNTITSLNQMTGQEVAVPSNEKAVSLIRAVGGKPVKVEDVSKGYELLKAGKVDALMYDEIPLEYILDSKDKSDYVLSKKSIEPQHYGFILPNNSLLLNKVNKEIIRMRESNEIENVISLWVSQH